VTGLTEQKICSPREALEFRPTHLDATRPRSGYGDQCGEAILASAA
jgi:hypothetical protein